MIEEKCILMKKKKKLVSYFSSFLFFILYLLNIPFAKRARKESKSNGRNPVSVINVRYATSSAIFFYIYTRDCVIFDTLL